MESQWFLELLECIRKESDSKKKNGCRKKKYRFYLCSGKKIICFVPLIQNPIETLLCFRQTKKTGSCSLAARRKPAPIIYILERHPSSSSTQLLVGLTFVLAQNVSG